MITVDADGNPLPLEFAAAVERGEQAVLTRLALDFDGDGYAGVDELRPDGITIDRALSTELPAQVRLATGYAAAELKAELSAGDPADDSTTAAAYFTRGSSSPIGAKERLRRPVIADVGYRTEAGPVLVRRFTGLTRTLPTSASRGTASLTALDLRERLRNTVVLIPTNGKDAGADGTWIVLQALYANGIAAGPLPRATGSLIWLPMYGSLNTVSAARDPSYLAFIVNGNGDTVPPRFRAGPYVLALDDVFHNSDNDTQRIVTNRTPESTTWDGMRGRFELWIFGVPNPTTGIPSSQGRCYSLLTNNDPSSLHPAARTGIRHNGTLFYDTHDAATDAVINAYSSSFVVPGDGRYHFVGIGWDFVAQRITFRLDDREETQVTSVTPATEVANPTNWWQFTSYASCSDIHLHGPIASTEPWLSQTVDVRAYLDPSTLLLAACVEDQPREAWELITEVADAEQAVVYFDEQGIFRYRTRRRLVDTAGQTVQRTLAAVSSLLELTVDDGIDQIRNVVQVSYEPVDVRDGFDFVYTDTTRRVVPANSFVEFTASLNDPTVDLFTFALLFSIIEPALPFGDPYLVATLNSDYTTDNGAILAYSTVITTDVTTWTPKAATVRITNGSPFPIYVTALGLKGLACTVGNRVVAEARNEASIAAWGAQPLQIQAPQWVQSADIAASLAHALVGDLKQPRRTIGTVTIVGDPRLQLGDRVALDYPSRPELSGEYWLTAIADKATASGDYTQDVALREATTVLRWGVGRWGKNTWG